MKELLISFLVCLVIGAIINGWSAPAPPVAPQPGVSEPGQPGTDQSTDTSTSTSSSSETGDAAGGSAGETSDQDQKTKQESLGLKAPETSDKNFDQDVLKSQVPVLVDFSAAWCAPCQTMAPIIDKLYADYNGKVKVYKVDTDRNPEVAGRFHVNSLPTFMMFRNGRPVSQYSGAMAKEMLAGVIDRQLGTQ